MTYAVTHGFIDEEHRARARALPRGAPRGRRGRQRDAPAVLLQRRPHDGAGRARGSRARPRAEPTCTRPARLLRRTPRRATRPRRRCARSAGSRALSSTTACRPTGSPSTAALMLWRAAASRKRSWTRLAAATSSAASPPAPRDAARRVPRSGRRRRAAALASDELVAGVWRSYGATVREHGIGDPFFVFGPERLAGPFRPDGVEPPVIVRGSAARHLAGPRGTARARSRVRRRARRAPPPRAPPPPPPRSSARRRWRALRPARARVSSPTRARRRATLGTAMTKRRTTAAAVFAPSFRARGGDGQQVGGSVSGRAEGSLASAVDPAERGGTSGSARTPPPPPGFQLGM